MKINKQSHVAKFSKQIKKKKKKKKKKTENISKNKNDLLDLANDRTETLDSP